MPVGAAVPLWGRENTSGSASMLGEAACGYGGFCCSWSSALGWGPCARFVLSSMCRVGASASPSPASIAPGVANSVWCLVRAGSFEAASLKKLKKPRIQ